MDRKTKLHVEALNFGGGIFIPEDITDKYFYKSKEVLNHAGKAPKVLMQVFCKKAGMVAGLYEGLQMLANHGARYAEVHSLLDGDMIQPWETVMTIEGDYRDFAMLETPLLGTIARHSLVATNAYNTVRAAGETPVMFMGARHDDWRVQSIDGYAAMLGGCASVSTDKNGHLPVVKGSGTMPHALIAAFEGDVVAASIAYKEWLILNKDQSPLVVLVDYHNDVIADSIAVCKALQKKFGAPPTAVRLDTSENLVDRSIAQGFGGRYGQVKPTGVTPELVKLLRYELDTLGFSSVGIVVSGGFNPKKIADFVAAKAPVTMYGVGSSIIGHNDGQNGLYSGMDFTADIVAVNGRTESKIGRIYNPNPRLVEVDLSKI